MDKEFQTLATEVGKGRFPKLQQVHIYCRRSWVVGTEAGEALAETFRALGIAFSVVLGHNPWVATERLAFLDHQEWIYSQLDMEQAIALGP